MKTTTKTEVIIVGAGPTGLSLACQFIRYGVDFIILDKKETITPYSKAVGIHARTLEIYEQIGLAEQAVSEGNITERVRMVEGGEVRGEVELLKVGEGLSTYPYMLILEQSKNERLLYDFLQSNGKEVQWLTELESFSQNDEGVTGQIKTANGETQTIEAKYLVGCDGPKSPVRHTLDLKFEGSTFERIFYVADVEIDWEFSHNALYVFMAQRSGIGFFPMPGTGRYRIVGAFPEEFAKDTDEILYKEIEERIKKEVEVEMDITHVHWFSTYKVHSRHVESFFKGRCFLAGDAAHVHTPMGGQGMNTGIQDAYNLAWKIAFVLKGAADAKIFETYNTERLENAKNLLGTTDRMFSMVSGGDFFVSLIRTTVFPPLAKYILSFKSVKKRFFKLISQIGINYRRHSLSQHKGDEHFEVKAGDRMPYFMVDGTSVYDRLREPKFHLLVFSDGESSYEDLKNQIENDYDNSVDFTVVPLYSHVEDIFGTDKSFQVLLRPDNYIGYVSSQISSDELKTYLTEFIGNPHGQNEVSRQSLSQSAVEA
jgi:2-polyprenyl-6-methoxyphenol hydroxylase-like FAD-dependent oxidoreductase